MIGTNPRHDAAIINARILKAVRDNGAKIGLIGQACDLNYDYDHLGTTPSDIEKLSKSRGGFAKVMKDAKKPNSYIG